jgi:excisionase family DNA binding protein
MAGTAITSGTSTDGPRRSLLTIAETADALNVPYNWLRVKVTERKVPHTRIGKHVRFTEQHLLQIIASGEIAALEDGHQAARPNPMMRGRRRRRAG